MDIIYRSKNKTVSNKEEEIITAYLQGFNKLTPAKYAVTLYVIDRILRNNNVQMRSKAEADALETQRYNESLIPTFEKGRELYISGVPLCKIITTLLL